MAITSVGGFFGSRTRLRRPAGVDVIFTTDQSGSMGPLIDFIDQYTTIQALENALIAENVGILVPNRYNKSSLQSLYQSVEGRAWELGVDILGDETLWLGWEATGFRWGGSQEDVTGSAYRIANTVYPYGYDTTNNPATNGSVFDNSNPDRAFRGNATQIIVAGSDEQSSAVQYFPNDVYARITDPATSVRYVAISNIRINYFGALPPEYEITTENFGIVFSSSTVWKLVLRPKLSSSLDPSVPVFLDVNANEISFEALNSSGPSIPIQDTSAAGPTVLVADNTTSGFQQRVNTPKLARGTSGAVYAIDQFFEPNGPPVFGESLGQTLGRFLYGLE